MIKYIIISNEPSGLIPEHPDRIIVSPNDFVANRVSGINLRKAGQIKVINMCRNYDYLSKGYYCSLLAEARGMRCVPSVSNIIQLNWKRHYQEALPELNALLDLALAGTTELAGIQTAALASSELGIEG